MMPQPDRPELGFAFILEETYNSKLEVEFRSEV